VGRAKPRTKSTATKRTAQGEPGRTAAGGRGRQAVARPRRAAAAGYEAHRDRAGRRQAEQSKTGRDIGEIPEVADPARRAAAEASFRTFCETYFPEVFYLPWSPDHLRVIGKIDQAVKRGGLFAMAMPRGGGKTSLCECAALWAILCGFRRYVCIIGSDRIHAEAMLESIKVELDCNEALTSDFPGACYPIQCLDGIANRCAGQTYRGERTHIEWTADQIVLASIPDEPAAGAVVTVAGITGRIRGMKHKTPQGEAIRPDLVIPDDPQTDESARSLTQCQRRESILAGAVLGLAGPGRKISGILPCTVITPGDMADRILNTDLHPEWNGERTKLMLSMPAKSARDLWDEYGEIRAESLRRGQTLRMATAFYRRHQAAMDKGAQAAWPERRNPDEASAIQNAMNLLLQDERAFWAEYQNEPLPEQAGNVEELTVDAICSKVNGLPPRRVPQGCEVLTAFIDVQSKLLYYAVCAWSQDFTGHVIDYGTWPDQQRAYFTQRDARRTLRRAAPGAGLEGSIYAGLDALTQRLLGEPWKRDDGAEMRIALCLVDQGWQADVVHQFCRQSPHAALLLPSRGAGIGAAQRPISEFDRKRGDRIGYYWWVPKLSGKRVLRHIEVDANYWKSFIHERIGAATGDRGALSLFGDKPARHQMLAEHLTAEYRVRTEGRGRTVDEWRLKAAKPDNHLFDCLVGCAAAASYQGVALPGTDARPGKTEKLRLSEIQRRRRLERDKQRSVRSWR
jgi:hypothetical protein